ncbi:MAG: 2-keto-4-pentenoate hydratase [Candidatus Entotheonellia bacterium]
MPDEDRSQQAARFLCEEHRARKPFAPMPATLAPRTIDEAYAVQEWFHTGMVAMHGPVAGYKIALTTPVMQQMVGFHAPIAGAILAGTIHRSPVVLRRADYVRLGIECEIAVQLGTDLPAAKAPYSRDQVADVVSAVMPAFELVDDRQADYAQLAAQVLTLIADNAWNAGIVLGAPRRDWHTVDLSAARGVMVINGTVVGEGHGRDVMGHPFEALLWLVNMLAQQGKGLTQGMIVMTGSLVATKFVNSGDTVSLSVEGLGEVRVSMV